MKALDIWNRFARECAPAEHFYAGKLPGFTGHSLAQEVLLHGAADFDSKYGLDDSREKTSYRSDFYVASYMDLHIKQNLAALQHCFRGDIPQPLLWVDFGCGPMTSGIALAEKLAAQHPGYKNATAYFGVDASKNMADKAQYINDRYKLFAPERFRVVQSAHFDGAQIPPKFAQAATFVLCCSFSLAPQTMKKHDMEKVMSFAADWKKFAEKHANCARTYVLYLNPHIGEHLHKNWRYFRYEMLVEPAVNFCYTGGDEKPLGGSGLPKPITCAIIRGDRQ